MSVFAILLLISLASGYLWGWYEIFRDQAAEYAIFRAQAGPKALKGDT